MIRAHKFVLNHKHCHALRSAAITAKVKALASSLCTSNQQPTHSNASTTTITTRSFSSLNKNPIASRFNFTNTLNSPQVPAISSFSRSQQQQKNIFSTWSKTTPVTAAAAATAAATAAKGNRFFDLASLKETFAEIEKQEQQQQRDGYTNTNWRSRRVMLAGGLLVALVALAGVSASSDPSKPFIVRSTSEDESDVGYVALLEWLEAKINSHWEQAKNMPALYALIALNVAVSLLWAFAKPIPAPRLARFMERHFLMSTYGVLFDLRVHTLFTSMFSHKTFWHLLFNMMVLHNFASFTLPILGTGPFLALYLFGGMSSSLASLLYKYLTKTAVASLGASGAVYAVVAFEAQHNPDARMGIMFLPQSWSLPAHTFFPLVCSAEIFAMLFLRRWSIFDHSGHMGGALYGWWYYKYLTDTGKGNRKNVHIVTLKGGRFMEYTGDLVRFRMEGHGRLVDKKTGITYEGNFERNLFTGYGVLTVPGKFKYMGDFKSDKFHGKGIMEDYTTAERIYGVWEEGKLVSGKRSPLGKFVVAPAVRKRWF